MVKSSESPLEAALKRNDPSIEQSKLATVPLICCTVPRILHHVHLFRTFFCLVRFAAFAT